MVFRGNNAIFVVMKQNNIIKAAVVLVWALLAGVATSYGQYIAVGARAPRIEASEWLTDKPSLRGKALLVEFFHSTNPACRERIDQLNQLADNYKEVLNVVVVAREPREQIAEMMLHEYQHVYVAIDEPGSVFGQFEVRYVPFSVLADRKGVILWTGNSALLDSKTLDKFFTTK